MTQFVFGALVLAFATLLTLHVTLAIGLARRIPPARALLALVVAPLVPWWAWRARMRVRGVLWVAAALAYGAVLALAIRG